MVASPRGWQDQLFFRRSGLQRGRRGGSVGTGSDTRENGGVGVGQRENDRALVALTEQVHLQDGFLSLGRGRMGRNGTKVGYTAAPLCCARRSLVSLRYPPHQPHLLGDGGVVVLQDEPLDVVSPHALLLHALGLRDTGRAVRSGRGFLGVPRVAPTPCPPTCRLCCCLPCL